MTEKTARKQRDVTSDLVKKDSPAYHVIYDLFGGPMPFCEICDFTRSAVRDWLNKGLIPSRYRENGMSYQAWILQKAEEKGIEMGPEAFIDRAE